MIKELMKLLSAAEKQQPWMIRLWQECMMSVTERWTQFQMISMRDCMRLLIICQFYLV